MSLPSKSLFHNNSVMTDSAAYFYGLHEPQVRAQQMDICSGVENVQLFMSFPAIWHLLKLTGFIVPRLLKRLRV